MNAEFEERSGPALHGSPSDTTVLPPLAPPRANGTAIVPSPSSCDLPLSAAQRELWLAQAAHSPNGTSTPNVIDEWFDFDSRIAGTLLQQAILLATHDFQTLQALYVSEDGILRQKIDPAYAPDCPLVDLSEESNPEAAIKLWLASDRAALTASGGTRQCSLPLFRLPSGRHRWCVQALHIAMDAFSGMLLAQRVSQIYCALAEGFPVPAHNLGNFENILKEDQGYRNSGQFERDRSYWHEVMARPVPAATLAVHRQDEEGAITLPVSLARDWNERLRALARRTNIPINGLLVAFASIYIFRMTGEENFTVGFPVTGRVGKTLRRTPGSLASILPLTVSMVANHTLAELARDLASRIRRLLRHQRYRISDLRRDLALHPQDVPLLRMSVNFLSFDYALRFGDSEFEVINGSTGDIEDLNFEFYDRQNGDGLTLQLKFRAGLYTEAEAGAHVERFGRLLNRMVDNPETPVAALDILPAAERTQVLYGFNDTAAPVPDGLCVHDLIARQAAASPQAVALLLDGVTLSYGELNARANRLAHHLVERGAGPGDRIGLCAERSFEMIVGLLAILKAGAAYVPLDPAYPSARLAHMIADSAPVLLLAQGSGLQALDEALAGNVIAGNDAPVRIDLLADAGLWADQPATDPVSPDLTPHSLAYVIYTSGSTGRPKGVMIEHRHLTARLAGVAETLNVKPSDRMPVVSSIAFDISLLEILLPLSAGASLRITDAGRIRDMDYLLDQTRDATLFNAVTSLMQAWINSCPTPALSHPALRTLLVGGEPVSQRLVNQLDAAFPGGRIVETYGPTEVTLFCTSCIAHTQADSDAQPPIGRPLPNTRIYILDPQGNPVPIGVTGEIHVGGACLARGYLNQPELTAERFRPDPFLSDPQARIYRTGDLGRWRQDGLIEFLGRSDFQLKIRGFRIEPGEIEARLCDHSQVREAVVIAREDQPGDRRLAAYVVPAAGVAPEAEALRAHLAQTLPEHMVPAAYVVLDRLPLTPNGKLDRNALPAPDLGAFATPDYESPQDENELLISAIWQELLGVERVGRFDNFFSLGGNSLHAVSMIERLRKAGRQADIRAIFSAPTLAELAKSLKHATKKEIPSNNIPEGCLAITPQMLPLVMLSQSEIDDLVRLVTGGSANVQDIYPLAPLQEGILFHYLLDEAADPYVLAGMAAFDDKEYLDRYLDAMQQVVDRHDILRTAIFWKNLSEPLQVVVRNARLKAESVVLSGDLPAEDEFRKLVDPFRRRIDLSAPPLLRLFYAHDKAQGRWLMMLLLHHLSGDHSTTDLMQEEIRACLEGRTLPMPTPFRNFVVLSRGQAADERRGAFFEVMLGDVKEPTTAFGQLAVRGDGTSLREESRVLTPPLLARLDRLANNSGIRKATLVHVAWALVLAHTSGMRSPVFGTVLFGRMNSRGAADSAMGPFINTLPICPPLRGTVLAAANDTQELLSQLMEYDQTPLTLAQRHSAVPSSLPLFTALLNYRYRAATSLLDTRFEIERMKWIWAEERTSFPLAMSVDDFGVSLRLVVQTDQAINPVQVCSLMEHALTELARALEDNPETPVAALDILPAAERTQVLYGFNDTAAPVPDGLCVHDLIARQAAASPQAVALLLDGVTLSYGELNARANRLAHHLVERGAGPGDRIGLCAERSFEMIVGLLAILKAGAAYVPLDPAYPSARLAHMIADSAPVLLLAQGSGLQALDEALAGNVIAGNDAPVRLDLLADAGLWADQPATDPVSPDLTPHSLAYVIYTSGSTGRPKGVMIEHMGLANLVMAQIAALDLAPQSRVLQFASIGFDASVFEIFATLCAGACLHLLPSGGSRDIAALQRRLAEEEISHVTLPSAVLATFDPAETLPRLKTLIVAGDALPPALANRWRRGRRLLNAYGPTETTVCATIHPCRHDHDGHVPIGRPIANTRIYILDERMRPVPVGVAGELWIGGIGVARGYLNQPELTAERFRPDPFLSDPQARIYDSGDLGRWMPDGTIDFSAAAISRSRSAASASSSGEIEARLCDHSQVREAVVIAREDQPGDKRLAAYVVPGRRGRARSRGAACPSCPDPARAHGPGRLCRPRPPAAYAQRQARPQRPARPRSRRLRHPHIRTAKRRDRADDRRHLAGTPRRRPRRSLRQLLQSRRKLAPCHARHRPAAPKSMPSICPWPRSSTGRFWRIWPNTSLPLRADQLPALEATERDGAGCRCRSRSSGCGFWRRWRASARPITSPRGCVFAASSTGRRCAARLTGSSHATRRCAPASAVTTTSPSRRSPPRTGICPDARRPRTHRVSEARHIALARNAEQRRARLRPRPRPADPRPPDPLEADDHVLLVTLHHIVADGWSIGVLMRELAALYAAFAADLPDPLPPLAIQYADYGLWQHRHLDEARIEAQAGYWQETLAGAPALLDLPADRRRPAVQDYAGATLPLRRSMPASPPAPSARPAPRHHPLHDPDGRLRRPARAPLGADPTSSSARPVANRLRREVEPLIGVFVNTLALRIDLADDPERGRTARPHPPHHVSPPRPIRTCPSSRSSSGSAPSAASPTPALPGDVHLAEATTRSPSICRGLELELLDAGAQHRQVRPDARPDRDGGRHRRHARIRHRAVRPRHHRALRRPAPADLLEAMVGERDRRRSRRCRCCPRRACAGGDGMERHGRGLSRHELLRAAAVRGAGGARARRRGPGVRRRRRCPMASSTPAPTGWPIT